MKFWIGFFVISILLIVMLPESRFIKNISKLNNLNKDERNQDKLNIILDKYDIGEFNKPTSNPYKYGISKSDYEELESNFLVQIEFINKNFGAVTWSASIVEYLLIGIEIREYNVWGFNERYNKLKNDFELLNIEKSKLENDKNYNFSDKKLIEKNIEEKTPPGLIRSFISALEYYNFLENYCEENKFKNKFFLNEIPFKGDEKENFLKAYNKIISPYFDKKCELQFTEKHYYYKEIYNWLSSNIEDDLNQTQDSPNFSIENYTKTLSYYNEALSFLFKYNKLINEIDSLVNQ